jgi:hypothetical protein
VDNPVQPGSMSLSSASPAFRAVCATYSNNPPYSRGSLYLFRPATNGIFLPVS